MAMDKATKRAKFEAAWTRIRTELVDHMASEGFPAEAVEWYAKVRHFLLDSVFLLIFY